MRGETDAYEYMAEEFDSQEDDVLLRVMRSGRMGALLFLLGFFTLMVLAARVLGYLLAKGKAAGGGKKRKQHKISVSSSSSLPVYDEDDSTDVPFRRGGERLRGFKVKSSSRTGLRVGMGLVPVVGMPARAGSSLTVDGETGIIYIYGGEGQDGGISEDLLTFSQKNGDWSWTRPRGHAVPGPLRHACLSVSPSSHHLLLYGGEGPQGSVNGDVFVMDMETGEWAMAMVEGEEKPGPRLGASLEAWAGHGWVMCGGVGPGSAHYSGVWLLTEVQGRQRGEVPAFTWVKLASSSARSSPAPRRCHSAVITAADEMLVLGGYPEVAEGAVEGAAVHVFDLKAREWRREKVRGVGPSGGPGGRAFNVGAQAGHVLFVGPKSTGVFNEVFVLDHTVPGAFEWLQADLDWQGDWTVIPGARAQYCAASDPASDVVFVFGGQDHSGRAQCQLLSLNAADVSPKTE